MYKLKHIMLTTVLSLFLVGCGATTWVKLNGNEADDNAIEEALKTCEYYSKKYDLNYEIKTNKYIISLSGAKGKAKQQLEDIIKDKETKFNIEMAECMRNEGLKSK